MPETGRPYNRLVSPDEAIHTEAMVVVPVKAFRRAKGRLSNVLDADARGELARSMGTTVLLAAAPLQVLVVCDDPEVADWARSRDALVHWTPGLGLNAAVGSAIDLLRADGIERAVIVHADLPFATDLSRFATLAGDAVAMVADRHGRGTNVMSVPTRSAMSFHYGPDSLRAHNRAAETAGLRVITVDDPALAWDVDEPADLDPPPELGDLSAMLARGRCWR